MNTYKQTWKLGMFVLLLNVFAIRDAIYLKSNGIDVYAFRDS